MIQRGCECCKGAGEGVQRRQLPESSRMPTVRRHRSPNSAKSGLLCKMSLTACSGFGSLRICSMRA